MGKGGANLPESVEFAFLKGRMSCTPAMSSMGLSHSFRCYFGSHGLQGVHAFTFMVRTPLQP